VFGIELSLTTKNPGAYKGRNALNSASALAVVRLDDLKREMLRQTPSSELILEPNVMKFTMPLPKQSIRLSGLDCVTNGSKLSIIATLRGRTNSYIHKIISMSARIPSPLLKALSLHFAERMLDWNTYKTSQVETYLREMTIPVAALAQPELTETVPLTVANEQDLTELSRANECNAEGVSIFGTALRVICDNHYGIPETNNRWIDLLI
jgi:hypothetical protein